MCESGGLGAGIGDRAPERTLTGHRRDVDHLPVPRCPQVGDGGHRDLPGADHVDVEDAAPDGRGGRLEVGVGDGHGGAGIVDQDVDSAVAFEAVGDETLGLVSSAMSACR